MTAQRGNDRAPEAMAVAYPSDIPGLFDVVMPDGSVVSDMTIGQLRTMAYHGYPIRKADL